VTLHLITLFEVPPGEYRVVKMKCDLVNTGLLQCSATWWIQGCYNEMPPGNRVVRSNVQSFA